MQAPPQLRTSSQAEEAEQLWPTWPRQGAPVSTREWGVPRPRNSLAVSAAIVAAGFVASRILGLVREIVLARQFGTSEALSAYVSAFRIPDLLFLVLMAGAFGSAFIPVFSGFLADGEDEAAWQLASVMLNLSGAGVVVFSAAAWVAAPQLVHYVVAPEASPEAQQITIECMRVLLFSPIFLGFGIAAKGILEGQDLFTLPAIAPVIYNLATIAGALVLGPRIGVQGVAIGVVVGAIGFLLVEIPGLVRSGMRYRLTANPRARGVPEVGRLLAPRLVGQAAFQINFIVVTNLAWRTGEQSVSALNYAWQLLMLPHGVLALSVSTVILPTLSRLWQQGDVDRFRATFTGAVRPLLFLAVPATIILVAFRVPLVQTLLQAGAFSPASTQLVAAPLAFLGAGLIGYALVEALARAFYAMHDTATPVVTGIAVIAFNIGLGLALMPSLGYLGLALALSLSTSIEAIVLAVILRHRLGGRAGSWLPWLTRVIAAGAATAAVAYLLAPPVIEATVPGTAPRFIQIAIFCVAVGVLGLVFFGCAWVLRIPELESAMSRVLSKLRPLVGRARPPVDTNPAARSLTNAADS